MNILIICNNYDRTTDGIGKYSKLMHDAYQAHKDIKHVYIETGYTQDNNKMRMVFSLEMSRAIFRAVCRLKKDRINCIIIEYPFQEYNPMVVLLYHILVLICNKNKIKVVVSIHEYLRANKLRQLVIRDFIRSAYVTFVSDSKTSDALKRYAKKIYIRNVFPNIFPKRQPDYEGKEDLFVYFGLVNRSKAFGEMLKAWKSYNGHHDSKLYILTSSDILPEVGTIKGIKVFHNLSDVEVASLLLKCRYMILPVLPEISSVNGTFKAAAVFGCICIGHFSVEYADKEFIIQLDSYKENDFVKGLEFAYGLSEEKKWKMFMESLEFGSQYHYLKTGRQVIEVIKECLAVEGERQ